MGKYYRFADHNFFIEPAFDTFYKFAKEYEISNCDNFITICNTVEEIENWKKDHHEDNFPLSYLETLVTHSKIADFLVKDNCFIFHGSTIYVDDLNHAFIFTAPSGTGKSTHVRLLMKKYPDRVNYVNDDKPFISFFDNKYYIYGSPWNGKERLSNNVKAELKGIFIVNRSKTNYTEKIEINEAYQILFKQIHLPNGFENTKKGNDFLFKLISQLPIYKLNVNMEENAPDASIEIINKIIKGEK